MIYNIGAIIGGISFGSLSERFGRRRIIIIAALLSLPVLPLWAFAASVVWLAVGAFLMQVMVQGAWGVIPVASERVVAGRCARDLPGLRLSARQPDRVGERDAAGRHRQPTTATNTGSRLPPSPAPSPS